MATPPTTDETIAKLSGGDLTTGSCSSLAFAYAGNKGGLDVTDYRGGNSCDFFATNQNIREIVKGAGGWITKHTNDFTAVEEIVTHIVEGKEYYFSTGRHAAIVRIVNGQLQYLEMQSAFPERNCFKPLTKFALKDRFKAQRSHTSYRMILEASTYLVDIEDLVKDPGYRKLMGYINTKPSAQQKGAGGTIK